MKHDHKKHTTVYSDYHTSCCSVDWLATSIYIKYIHPQAQRLKIDKYKIKCYKLIYVYTQGMQLTGFMCTLPTIYQ